MSKYRIELYTDKYKDDLEVLLSECSKELYDYGKCDIDIFIKEHWAIYLGIDSITGKAVGFCSFAFYGYFGMRDNILCNTYLYVDKKYRNTKVSILLTTQVFAVGKDTTLPIEINIASIGSEKLTRRLKGKKIYETYIYESSEFERVYKSLSKKIKLKGY